MKKYYTIFFSLFVVLRVFSQTGINTIAPHPSAELDISSVDRGLLIPQHVLTDLNSSVTPVQSPREGTMIYNTGGPYIRGYYYWDGQSWNRLIVNRETDQILNMKISGTYTGGAGDQSKLLIPSGTANNYISFAPAVTQYINTMGIANPTNQNINLPAGTYKVDVSVDCISPTAPNVNFLVGNSHLYVVEAGIVNSANLLLTDFKTSTLVSGAGIGSVQGYIFSFVFKLETPQVVRLLLRHGPGRTTNVETRTNQSGLTVNFYRFFE